MEGRLFIILILYQSCTESSMLCSPKYTNRPLHGYYCDGQPFRARGNEGICKQTCFESTKCGAMSFNPENGTCLLATQPCALAGKHNEYRLMVLRPKQYVECAIWVPDRNGIIPTRLVSLGVNANVGRISVDGNMLVGNAARPGESWNTYTVHEGQMRLYPNQYLLTVHPNCTMAWVPYTAGEVLPEKAVVTGMLANGRRLYCSLSWHTSPGKWAIGVYAEGDTAAYYAHGGSNAVTQFDILVTV